MLGEAVGKPLRRQGVMVLGLELTTVLCRCAYDASLQRVNEPTHLLACPCSLYLSPFPRLPVLVGHLRLPTEAECTRCTPPSLAAQVMHRFKRVVDQSNMAMQLLNRVQDVMTSQQQQRAAAGAGGGPGAGPGAGAGPGQGMLPGMPGMPGMPFPPGMVPPPGMAFPPGMMPPPPGMGMGMGMLPPGMMPPPLPGMGMGVGAFPPGVGMGMGMLPPGMMPPGAMVPTPPQPPRR